MATKVTEGFEGISAEERKKILTAKRVAKFREGMGEIGSIPPCKNPKRREACGKDFDLYCRTYFPDEFYLAESEDHKIVSKKMEKVILENEIYAIAMPRGSGKTTKAEKAGMWAVCYAYKKFIVLVGSDKGASTRVLESIRVSFETNDLLAEDFPEICIPIIKLDGLAQRAHSQTFQGVQTRIRWSVDKLVMPTIEGSKSSGITIQSFGLTGGIRGLKHSLASGEKIRPDLCILDDPQTDESAKSPSQNTQRVNLLAGAILKLSGPDKKMSAIMPCTVIQSGDMAHQILDRKKHPRWQGDIMKMIYEFPKNLEIWDEYKKVWQEGLENEDGGEAGNKFYVDNRAKMDEGSIIAWEERIEQGDISALQSAMNFFLENEEAFMAEYQNDPITDGDDPESQLHIEDLRVRCNNMPKGLVPTQYSRLVGFIDVGSISGINYVVMAIGENFTGSIVDYGIVKVKTGKGYDEQAEVWAGIELALERITKFYQIDNGVEMQCERIGVDSGWNTDLVYRLCRESPHSAILFPTKGAFVKPADRLYKSKSKGAIKGTEWIYASTQSGARPVKLFRYNTNYWKTFTFARFRAPTGGSGALLFYGKAKNHTKLFEHMTAEYRTKVTVENKDYDIWEKRVGMENHWFDCVVGCCALGDYIGVGIFGRSERSFKKKRKLRIAQ